ncbi:hypothetical protein EW146_g532 [Bondarzewia mesenterica]|uniref:RING-type domain-containing protein n=1 Tax=Bondarzewia mesenterica TaxID=1095465 RepID=A0A4S4M802_9AGAM|nr:hypothetical protein EW146_g532 [Bondarzewia mesenterica]
MPNSATRTQTRARVQRGTNRRGRTDGPRSGSGRPSGVPAHVDNAPKPDGDQAVKAAALETQENEEVDENSVCWICAEPVKYYSVSQCNHRTCHVCALRLRALYKRMDCTFCKEPQPSVIFTTSADKPFSSYAPIDIPHKDSKLNIFFETQEMMEETLILLRYNCPESTCEFTATGWNDLKLHARGVHGKLMCDLCIRNKKSIRA